MTNKNECTYMQKMECGIYQKRRRREKWDEGVECVAWVWAYIQGVLSFL